jgi:predicted transcriptional regulator
LLGTIALWSVARVPPEDWDNSTVLDLTDRRIMRIPPDSDVLEALRLLMSEAERPLVLVVSRDGSLAGIVTKTDILSALKVRRKSLANEEPEAALEEC